MPALIALQKAPPTRERRRVLRDTNVALVRIGTRDSTQAVVDWLATMRPMATDKRSEEEMVDAVGAFVDLPPGVPLDYDRLRSALPAELSSPLRLALVDVIIKRNEPRGVPELILFLQYPNEAAVTAVIAMGTPDDLRAARRQIQASTNEKSPPNIFVANMLSRLDVALDNAPGGGARRSSEARAADFDVAAADLARRRMRAAAIKDADASRYSSDVEAALQESATLLAQFPNAGERDSCAGTRRKSSCVSRMSSGFSSGNRSAPSVSTKRPCS